MRTFTSGTLVRPDPAWRRRQVEGVCEPLGEMWEERTDGVLGCGTEMWSARAAGMPLLRGPDLLRLGAGKMCRRPSGIFYMLAGGPARRAGDGW